MKNVPKKLFGVALSITAISGLLAIGHGGIFGSIWSPLFFAGLAAMVGLKVRGAYLLSRPTRTGSLTRRRRPALTKDEVTEAGVTINAAIFSYSAKMKATNNNPPPAEKITIEALLAMRKGWSRPANSDAAASHDELRSSFKLLKFAASLTGTDADLKSPFLRDVADRATFLDMRDRLLAARAVEQSSEGAYKAWLSHIGGDRYAGHLLANGWLPFLQSMPGRDFHLWHQIANDTHDMLMPEIMRGVFWALEQAECDRATAADFIRGFVYWTCLESAAENVVRGGDRWILDEFRAVIARWNSGFYRHQTLVSASDQHTTAKYTQNLLTAGLAKASKIAGVPAFPDPVGVTLGLPFASTPRKATWQSPYEYLPGEGLRLRYPGPDLAKKAG